MKKASAFKNFWKGASVCVVLVICWIGMFFYWLFVDVIFSFFYMIVRIILRKGRVDLERDYIDKLPK